MEILRIYPEDTRESVMAIVKKEIFKALPLVRLRQKAPEKISTPRQQWLDSVEQS